MSWTEQTLSAKKKKELILKQVSIFDVLDKYGIDYDQEKIPCPFPDHNECIPSFMIYRDTNSFHCFGCNRGSNVVDFVIYKEGCSFLEALDKLMPLRKESNDLDRAVQDIKDAYVFNMNCDIRDFLYGLRKFGVYEKERKRVDVLFKKLDEKLKRIKKNDEQELKRLHGLVEEYIVKRKRDLIQRLDGYNEERIK